MAAPRTATVDGVIVRRLIGALILLAFSFQSYLAQTHIHEAVAATSAALSYHQGQSKPPVDNSPLDCPFCQAVTHVASFLMPGVLLPFLAPDWVKITTLHTLLADKGTVTRHDWQSRAPPSR